MQPIRAMFEKEPFGALERLVTQKLPDVAKRVTKQELNDENWLRLVVGSGGSYRTLRRAESSQRSNRSDLAGSPAAMPT